MAKRKAPGARLRPGAGQARDMSVTVKMSPQEYQLLSYAASKSRARGIHMWMRERLLEAARARVPERRADEIIHGTATAGLLEESLKEARSGKRRGRVLLFKRE